MPGRSPRPARFENLAWVLHVLTLSCLAVAQPVLDLLARNAELFVVRRSSGGEILSLVPVLLILPLPLILLVAVARLGRRLGVLAHDIVMGALAALLTLLILTRTALLDGVPWLGAGLASGVIFSWAYHRFPAVRTLTTYLGVALVAVPAVFLFHPGIRKVTFGGAEGTELHATGARAPIVFLIFDELSATVLLDQNRRIDEQSFPHLAAFAREATWFADATTVSDVTELAVPAILTGGFPDQDRLPILRDYPRNLFTLFGDYDLWALEPITRLCPAELNTAEARAPAGSLYADLWTVYRHLLLAPRYAARLPVISDRWQSFGKAGRPAPGAGDFTQAAITALDRDRRVDLRRYLDSFDAEGDPSLHFLHVLLPHVPWEYLPSGKAYATLTDRIPGLEKERWLDDETFTVQAYRRYLLQARFLDRWFGELVDRLRRLGLYDRSLIVFTADHGVSFRPGDSRRLLSATNVHDLIAVPLLIKAPFQRQGRVIERPVTTLDILPSILDLLEVESPWPLAGRSAFAESQRDAVRRVVGKYRAIELDQDFGAQHRTLDWKLATFGTGAADFWRAGTHPELYGRNTGELGWRRQDTVKLRLQGGTQLLSHDASGSYSPAFLSGSLATADLDCCDLAVAVNGIVQATVRTFGSPPDLRFNALVPDQAFRSGENRVEVFRIRGSQLELLGASGAAPYSLVLDQGRVVAVRQGDHQLPIRPGALKGFVESVKLAGKVRVSGWAADLEAGAAPEQILVFHHGEMVYSGFTTKTRGDISAANGLEKSVRTVFQLQLPSAGLEDLTRTGLRLFALSNNAALELGVLYSLERGEDHRVESIRLTNGREIPVSAALTGHLDAVEREGDAWVLRGWAADLAHREPPETILTFAGDSLIHRSGRFVERADVAADHDMPEILRSGFENRVTAAASAELLVFAVSRRGEATLLPVP